MSGMSEPKATLRRRPLVFTLAVAMAVTVVAALAAGSVEPSDTGPGGIGALKRLLRDRGVDLLTADRPSAGQTFFVIEDARSLEDAQQVLEWVREGGRAVVADPSSLILLEAGVMEAPQPAGGFSLDAALTAHCAMPLAAGVERLEIHSLDSVYQPGPPGALGCFATEEGAFLVRRRMGAGELVALGGISPFTNEYLRRRDNALLAWNALGSGERVALATPRPLVGGSPSLWSLLPGAAQVIILQALVVALLFAVLRGRRLGKPVEEPVPSPIPATELVRATGDLYRRARATEHSFGLLRRRFLGRAGRRLGIPPGSSEEQVLEAVAATTGIGREEIDAIVRAAPSIDQQLVRAARALEQLERRMEGEVAWQR